MNIGQIYHISSILCYVLSILAFSFAVFLFFRYRIIDAFNVLSGRKLKQDMERLSHLSGAASENSDLEIRSSDSKKQKKKPIRKKKEETEELSGLSGGSASEKYDTEDWEESNSASETEELYDTETTEDLSSTTDATDELDILFTTASDTDLL